MALGIVAIVAGAGAMAGTRQDQEPTPVRVGVYDSRGVAIAWARSKTFQESLAPKRKEYEEAKARGDDARVAAIDAEMQAQQQQFHLQGFGTWPVHELVAHLADQLPDIAAAAGVDLIVSKWDVDWQAEGVVFVDVTERMAAPFHPDEATLKILRQLPHQAPVANDKLKGHVD